VELGGDLLRRAALLEEAQHLDLSGRQARRGWRRRPVVVTLFQEPEDADVPLTVPERHGADLDGHSRSAARERPAHRWTTWCRALLGDQLAGAATVLGGDDRGEVAAANVAEQALCSRIEQRTIPVESST
jgi:hypothetical protein